MSVKNIFFVLILYLLSGRGWTGFAQTKIYQEMISDEKELKVRLNFSGGKIFLKKTNDLVVYRLTLCGRTHDTPPFIRYTRSGSTGYLSLEMELMDIFEDHDFCWILELSSHLPVSFQAEMGAGKGQLDLTDIRLRETYLNFGASSMKVMFNAPNRERMRKMQVHAGLAKLKFYGLQNANMEEMEFNGGIGSYILSFDGLIKETSTVKVNLGVGKMLMEIPESINMMLCLDKSYLTAVSMPEDLFDEKTDGIYYSKKYFPDLPQLRMYIQAGVGKLRIEKITP